MIGQVEIPWADLAPVTALAIVVLLMNIQQHKTNNRSMDAHLASMKTIAENTNATANNAKATEKMAESIDRLAVELREDRRDRRDRE